MVKPVLLQAPPFFFFKVWGKNVNFCLIHSGALSVTSKVSVVTPAIPHSHRCCWKASSGSHGLSPSWQKRPHRFRWAPRSILMLDRPHPGSPHFNLPHPWLCWHSSHCTRSPAGACTAPGVQGDTLGCAGGHPREQGWVLGSSAADLT